MNLDQFTYDGSRKIDLFHAETGASKDEKKKKDEYLKKTAENIQKIALYQEKLYAEGKEGLIFVLQARDAAGKDSTIKHIMTGVNPQGVEVHGFKTPNKDELAHDFLWRFNKVLPARGMMSILNRSYYEDVLVVKVHALDKTYKMPARCLGEGFFERRYRHIMNYEEELYDNGYEILKVFLDVSKKKQKERFLERIDRPEKNWKFSTGDLDERSLWDDYTKAYEEMIDNTASKECPWYVIPSDQKWYARYLITEILVNRFEKMDPQFPELPESEMNRLQDAKARLLAEDADEKKNDDKEED